jgi:hypothetical protein
MKNYFIFIFLILSLQLNTVLADVVCEKSEPKLEEAITFAEGMGELLTLEYNNDEVVNYTPENQDPAAYQYAQEMKDQSARTLSILNRGGLGDIVMLTESSARRPHLVNDYKNTPGPRNFNEFKSHGNNQQVMNILSQDVSHLHFSLKKQLIHEANTTDTSVLGRNEGRTYLTHEEAQELINESKEMASANISARGINGACFLRSSHISHELSKKYAHIPTIKLWATGDMSHAGHQWPYHTVTMVPVVVDKNIILRKFDDGSQKFYKVIGIDPSGKRIARPVVDSTEIEIKYMALDTLLADRGPLLIEEWSKVFLENGAPGPVDLKVSTSDRLSPSAPNCNYDNVDQVFPKFWEALSAADRGLKYTPDVPVEYAVQPAQKKKISIWPWKWRFGKGN